ncbi:hypothetical protein RDABS01_033812 [Bienertia sinuspersici]
MWTMGEDFRYQYANSWFRQMDKFIHYVNLDGRVNALYSTPSIYTNAKYATNESWPVKTDDFFPYADRANAYWTGYFTSRPAFKGYVRLMSSYYMAARQLEYFHGRKDSRSKSETETLADALAIAQHHDAVTGTERQHVADDYTMRLHLGYLEAEKVVSSSLSSMTSKHGNTKTSFQQAIHFEEPEKLCPLLNISYCPPSETLLSSEKNLVVVVYNPLGWNREEVIRIPVTIDKVTVKDFDGKEVESQLVPLTNASLSLRNDHMKAYLGKTSDAAIKYWLAFSVSVPPLGFSTYIVSGAQAGARSKISSTSTIQGNINSTVEVGQGNLKLLYSVDGEKLVQYVNSRNSVSESVDHSFNYYTGFSGTNGDTQASGAYIFRPNGTFAIKPEGEVSIYSFNIMLSRSKVKLVPRLLRQQTPGNCLHFYRDYTQGSSTVMRGPLFDEVHRQPTSWIHQITRVYKGKEHAEIEFTIGPIPVDDGAGKEIITQIKTTMKTNKTFYTDSNGRDFIKRILDHRADWDLEVSQPIAGNYYPINLGIYVEDGTKELSVLVDRAVGGSSIMDGQIELMLHRRLLHDDARGVGEILNETVCALDDCKGLTIKGKYYIRIDPIGEGAKWRRTFGQEIYSPLIMAFAQQDEDDWMSSHVSTFSGLSSSYSLPDNVAIITLQARSGARQWESIASACPPFRGYRFLSLSLPAYIGEDKDLSVMAHVELKKLFPNKNIKKVTETSLSANQERTEMEKKRLSWKTDDSSETVTKGGPVDPVKLVVELAPMEIRTFLVDLEYIKMFGF